MEHQAWGVIAVDRHQVHMECQVKEKVDLLVLVKVKLEDHQVLMGLPVLGEMEAITVAIHLDPTEFQIKEVVDLE